MSEKIDIFEKACSVDAGEPQEITLRGNDLTIRRNFTADEVHKIIRLYGPEVADQKLEEVTRELIELISTSEEKAKADFVDDLMQLSFPEFNKVQITLTQLAGIRGEDGNFLTGSKDS
ncbi:hypothetical protein [Corynebacterium belfantii]|uniref:hypothetical protein n=1 Tax=Corynebacterium belfantii TaxID=2014537 RepID=UPI0035A8AE5D